MFGLTTGLKGLRKLAPSAVLLATVAAHAPGDDYTQYNLTWTAGTMRMNEVQLLGSHNSYHVAVEDGREKASQELLLKHVEDYRYTHSDLETQLGELYLRNLELDIHADPFGGNYARPAVLKRAGMPLPADPAYQKPGTKVMHEPDTDIHSHCATLIQCLTVIKSWLDRHPFAVPIPIMVEFKKAKGRWSDQGGAIPTEWAHEPFLDYVDDEIRAVFGPEQLITPDHVRRHDLTLDQSIRYYGWPDINSARGRVFFLMDNGPNSDIRHEYRKRSPVLEGRVLFTNASPGDPDCAFQKINDPSSRGKRNHIQTQVAKGYWVRTRSDVPGNICKKGRKKRMRREMAFESGAQIISTDFEAKGMSSRWGCDFTVRFSKTDRGVRCNPVTGPKWCKDEMLEPASYFTKNNGIWN